MPASVFHVFTNQVADGTATSVVRPSDWNSGHAITLAPSGQEIIGAFSNGGNVTFGTNTAGYVTASAPSGGTGGGGGVAISAGTNSTATGTVVLSNSNGLSFGMGTNGVVTGSYTVPTDYMNTLERGNYFYTSNNTFANSTHSHGNIAFSGTNVSATFTTASNGLSIQLSAPTVGGAQTGISGISAGTTQMTSGTAVFGNANGVSFGVNGNTITASHNALTQQSTQPVAYSAANGSANFSTLTFANSNGVSFSTGTQGLYATVKTDYLTTARASNDAIGLNTAVSNVTATINSSGLSLDARGYAGTGTTTAGANVSFSVTLNSNGLNLSGSVSPGGAGDGYNSAQFTNSTANSTMPLLWAGNSNGSGNITIGLTGSTITMSAPSGGGGVAISAGANSQNTGTVAFSNSNGISFGLNAGTVTASYTVPTQTVQPVAYSAANGSANFSTLTFANSNGVSFSTGTQGLYATVKTDYQSSNANYLTSQSNQAVSAANGSFAFQTVTFANSNGISFSTGTQGLYASHNGITQQSTQPVAYSAANGSAAFSTLTFANSNGVSFSTGTQGLYATVRTDYASSSHSHGNPTLALTNINGTTASASNGLTLSLSAVVPAQTVQPVAVSGSNGSFNFSTLSFGNLNGLSFYTSNGSIVGSYTDAGAGGGISAVVITAGTTNTAVSNFSFADANNVSFGINGSTITASVNPGGGGGATLSYYDNMVGGGAGATVALSSRVSQASTIWLFPLAGRMAFPGAMTVSTALFNVFNSGNTNSLSAALTYTWGFGVYEVTNGSQLTLVGKASTTFGHTAATQATQSWVGQRWVSIHSSQFSNATGGATALALAGGKTYVGALSISSVGSAVQTHNIIGQYGWSTAARSGYLGAVSDANNTTKGFFPFIGQFSATSTAFPSSIGLNQINRQVASGNFIPQIVFNNLTAV